MNATAMKIDFEANRLAARDRAVAISIGQQMAERYFDPLRIEDMRDVRQQVTRAAEHAAYEAIQKERSLHAEDMLLIKAWFDLRMADEMTRPRPFIHSKPEATP